MKNSMKKAIALLTASLLLGAAGLTGAGAASVRADEKAAALATPEIKETLDNIDEYDTIYIGFPNWWGTLPMPMFTQLEQLDFTGKVVKPFVTHEGSGFGSSQRDLAKLCEGAEIKNGLSIPGANVYDVKDTVKAWIDE